MKSENKHKKTLGLKFSEWNVLESSQFCSLIYLVKTVSQQEHESEGGFESPQTWYLFLFCCAHCCL